MLVLHTHVLRVHKGDVMKEDLNVAMLGILGFCILVISLLTVKLDQMSDTVKMARVSCSIFGVSNQ